MSRIRSRSVGANHYWAEAWEDGGKFYYRAKGVTIEVPEQRYPMILVNPHLYYFSSALWLHYQIIGERKKQGLRS